MNMTRLNEKKLNPKNIDTGIISSTVQNEAERVLDWLDNFKPSLTATTDIGEIQPLQLRFLESRLLYGSVTFEPWKRLWKSWAPSECNFMVGHSEQMLGGLAHSSNVCHVIRRKSARHIRFLV